MNYNYFTKILGIDSTKKKKKDDLTFVKDISKLINNPDFSDVSFIVDGKEIYCHKALLATRSDHFRAMFTSGMRESREHQIEIKDIRYDIFLDIVQYLYIDAVEICSENVIELYMTADLYGIDKLKKICESKLQGLMSINNVGYMLQAAEDLQATSIRDQCIKFIVQNFDTVTKTESFQILSRSLILEILYHR